MNTDSLTLGFIGYGNMAQAMAQGLVDAGVLPGGRIVACAAHYDRLVERTAQLGVRPMHSGTEVAAAADLVILAVKPGQVAQVCEPIRHELADPDRMVLSVVGGMTLEDYADILEEGSWVHLYDPDRLADNQVPLQAAVYADDLYVPSELQLDTLSRVGHAHAWVTNEFEHDGLHGDRVFAHLYRLALERGDLEGLFPARG